MEAVMTKATSVTRHLWFLNGRLTVRVSCADGTDRISILEHQAPQGESPPLHIHRNQDEVFHILEGDLRFVVGGRELRAGAGETVITPKGTPHTYRVESPLGARWLIVTVGEDFENFVRAFARAAEREGLPDPSGPPTPDEAQALASVALQHGIELVGPPLDAPTERQH
jgi:mannose-6-phosphate isomerase-like protein (cupin superfamily)